IAATNKNVESEIAEGRFREDLYYRLNVVPVTLPPLRARREDIPLLIERFVFELSKGAGFPRKPFTPEAVDVMQRGEWPGDVRELRNMVERLLILSSGKEVTDADVQRGMAPSHDGPIGDLVNSATFETFKEDAERQFLIAKLTENGWNV